MNLLNPTNHCIYVRISHLKYIFKYMFKHKHNMSFKTITIKDRVYEELIKIKGEDESFSDLFEKMVRKEKPDLSRFYGVWKMNDREWKKIEKAIKERRDSADSNWKERGKIVNEDSRQ